MKKMISIILALMLSLCMSITAFAAEINIRDGSTSTDVKGTYVSGGSTATVYSVDVVWGSMEFTYTDAFTGTWNPVTHEYDGATSAAWSCDENANKITVTNHSNTSVFASLIYSPKEGFDGISGSFSKSNISLSTAAGVSPENAPTDSSLLTLSGELSYAGDDPAVIGSVTVELLSD